jgi:hypothetical protein
MSKLKDQFIAFSLLLWMFIATAVYIVNNGSSESWAFLKPLGLNDFFVHIQSILHEFFGRPFRPF